jgi:hypothetical protein
MTATYTLTGSELIVALSCGDAIGHHGMDAEWACLGGDWYGVYVGDSDRRSCIITGGGGGREWTTPDRRSFPSDVLTGGGVGFYDGGGWVADTSSGYYGIADPTVTVAGCVAVVRSWIHDGDLPDGLVDGR